MAMWDLNYLEEMKRAEEGDLASMFNVAAYIVWGDPASPVEPEAALLAVRYFTANADAGDTDSMLDLGGMYLEGRGVEKDSEKALAWYKKAAQLNGPRACRCLGNYYKYDVLDDGTPVPTADKERLKEALAWYRLGTERGEENCMYELGDAYRDGVLVEKDGKKAFELYEKAYDACRELMKDRFLANDSYADVCYRLALCYHYGIGTQKDMEKARTFIEVAKKEAKTWVDDGDKYVGAVYSAAKREWQAIFSETGF